MGYQADITINGKRLRAVFTSRKRAETYVEEAKFAAKLKRAGVGRAVNPPTVRELFNARLKKITDRAEKMAMSSVSS